MKYSVITFGCRVNQADSLGFEEELLAEGATCAPVDEADLIVVNTCSVTASADQGARQTIRRIARQNPAAQVVVTGCYATRRPEEVGQLHNVVRVIANDDKPRLISILQSAGVGRGLNLQSGLHPAPSDCNLTSAERFGDGDGSCGATIEPGFGGRTAFTLRVQTGCGESCSYCIIPTTRGRPRSVAVDHVLREVRRVAGAGFKEIALTGVHLGSYGRDLVPGSTLVDLLRALADDSTTGDVLFRISSLEPMDCTPAIVALVAEGGRFAPHFHLPLQHASDRVLTLMRRPYTFRYYQALVAGIRQDVPGASIGSDIIVGFPGETDQDFAELAAYLETSPLTHIHVFPYSDRPGTAASGMAGKVPGPVVRDRGRRIREISARLSARFLASQVGTVHRALTLEDGSLTVTGNYLKVRIPPGHARNEWVSIRLVSHDHGELLCR
jgi:threonylcarbamoyladenosine tRNA methylthiotransferase MtaB